MAELIPYQIHRHTITCSKKRRIIQTCRFKYPKPPMTQTKILLPLPKNVPTEEHKRLTQLYSKVDNQLNAWGRNYDDNTTVEEMLQIIDIYYEDYISAVRTTISRPTIFLKRKPRDNFVNAYNTKILLAWRANMDIQFVLNGYASGKYVAS